MRFVRKITQRQKSQQNLYYNEVENILERMGKLTLLICQELTAILVYKFGWILLLDELRLFPVILNRLRRLERF